MGNLLKGLIVFTKPEQISPLPFILKRAPFLLRLQEEDI